MTQKKSAQWQALSQGDVVDVIAPGFRCAREVIPLAAEFLKSWGLKPRIPKNIFGRDLLCTNPVEERFRQFKTALLAKESKVIWCLRGGYGSLHLLPHLQQMKRPRQPKLVIGLSDVTSLHTFLVEEWGWTVLHTTLLDRPAQGQVRPTELKLLRQVLFGERQEVEFGNLKGINALAKSQKTIRAPIIGGNLTVLQSHLATPFEWDARGKMLFIEDIGERGYRVDRILTQFEQSGKLQGVRALLVGEFIGGVDPDKRDRVMPVIRQFAEHLKIPVVAGIQNGHGTVQRPIAFGPAATLKLGKSLKLICPTNSSVARRRP